MIKLLKYLLPYWWQIVLLVLGLVLQVTANLKLPDLMSGIIDQGIMTEDIGYVWSVGFQMLAIALAGGAGMIMAGFFAAKVGTGFARQIREDLFKHILSFSIDEIDQFSTASLLTRTTNDVNQIQQTLVMVLRMSCQAPIMAVGAVAMAFQTAPDMTWIIALVVGALVAIIVVIIIIGLPKFQLIQKLNDKLNLVTRENLTGLRVVRAFNNERYEERKFDVANHDVTKVNVFVNRLMVVMTPLVQLALSLATVLIVWVGAGLVDKGSLEIGKVLAFVQYAMQVMIAFMFLAMAFVILPRAIVSWKRIVQVLNTKLSIEWTDESAKNSVAQSGAGVHFENVSFAYKDAEEAVVKNISFSAKKGETTAIIGSTGSGKTTIIDLMTRSHDVTSGEILLDGKNIKNYSQADLMKKIGLVSQKAVLFSGTIESNIKFGAAGISEKAMKKAAEIAGALGFIEKLEDGFKSHVAQGGANFSGGQKQRLSIARVVAKRPEVYLFDDSFSALDYKTDLAVRQALKPITKKAAVIIVGQRIGTIKHADQIIVLQDGEIVGSGRHYELLKSCEVYRQIAESQLSAEELRKELDYVEK
ncbi:MAG: ABC transporter ATP-binding protein/permease [Candidatus Nomurabacteria bacterium]|jgi:ATP-binding cassette subfamily B protein|nr:ABC transporter ATP-binding protein/permease [Candidatus Nomurabacteria bacterium]